MVVLDCCCFVVVPGYYHYCWCLVVARVEMRLRMAEVPGRMIHWGCSSVERETGRELEAVTGTATGFAGRVLCAVVVTEEVEEALRDFATRFAATVLVAVVVVVAAGATEA